MWKQTNTQHVETNLSKQEMEHVGRQSVLHVATTVNPPEMTENAAVLNPTVKNVDAAIKQEKPGETRFQPTPVADVTKDSPPNYQNCKHAP